MRTTVGFSLALLLLANAAWARKGQPLPLKTAQRFVRAKKSFSRDSRRVAKAKHTPVDFGENLQKREGLFRGLDGDNTWRFSPKKGTYHFDIPLSEQVSLQGDVAFYPGVGPFPNVRKLKKMAMARRNKNHPLFKDGGLGVFIDNTTGFFYKNNDIVQSPGERGYAQLSGVRSRPTAFDQIHWHGPISRYALFAYLHEQGHANDWKKLGQPGKDALRSIYNKVADAAPLTEREHRLLVGFERSAWAHALNDVRALRRENMPLLENRPIKELMTVVHGSLRSYYEYQGDPAH
ncbi:MAG: hypothetical protein JRH20_12540 [Deltaproteobacteria bacterium]|nr:hypothetical protein [Deltaproteobacteria bacterium]